MSPAQLLEELRAAGAWEGFREKFNILELDNGVLWDIDGPLDFLEGTE